MKKSLLATGVILCLSAAAHAQSANTAASAPTGQQAAVVDLRYDPKQASPLPASRSNAALLRDNAAQARPAAASDATNQASPNPQLVQPAGSPAPAPYQSTMNASSPGTTGSSVQPVNATTQQFNLGNQKASSTLYYDNTGKMTGHKTTIHLGK